MKPTRRVLLAIVLLVLTLVVLLFTSWHFQTSKLADALIADIETTQARVITRDPPPDTPLH